MSKTLRIFGFGSLMSAGSLKTTVPNSHDLRPSYIKGLIRDFSVWDQAGFTDTNLDLAGIPFCALAVKKVADSEVRVNGITFQMDQTNLNRLTKREHDYSLIKTTAYDFHSNELIGECLFFSAKKTSGSFDFNSDVQKRYLQVCLQGSRQYGDRFYQEFIDTTFIAGQRLSQFPELLSGTSY